LFFNVNDVVGFMIINDSEQSCVCVYHN
jgi:hypothetical protein